jgi:aminopeptidase N
MNRFYLSVVSMCLFFACKPGDSVIQNKPESQQETNQSATGKYRSSYTRSFRLIHSKLNLIPDWQNQELTGNASIVLHPYFYPSDSLVLNARGMLIHSVEEEKGDMVSPLPYIYTEDKLRIGLGKTYTQADTLTVRISYTSRPGLLAYGGSSAIHKDKGLYFINADGKHPYKPRQLWTQGETESASAWFPTIEDPSQRMTQEIYLTVDTHFITVSNGLLLASLTNPDGTRTDYWKQSVPMAPYLSMIAVSDFGIVKDKWNDVEVSYYIDKDYAPYASLIFGNTPEMMSYFSGLFGIRYPFEKYSQLVVHDFVSGAMENNTAVIHGAHMLQVPREHKDYNYEDIIAHELVHHWFGNLVTCESWSNVTLNEGFATYGEYLWFEHKYGREAADYHNDQDLHQYLRTTKRNDEPLIRFMYKHREDVYDPVSYQKGSRVLHMLRKLTGDEAFFMALQNYLKKYSYKSVEFHHLRLEFEEITGQDLNWFFNQWFLQAGKPSLEISYSWSDSSKSMQVEISQTQNTSKNGVYRLPMAIDFYFPDTVIRRQIILDSLFQTFHFQFTSEPLLVNVDAEKMLLLEYKKDNKSGEDWIFQYKNAPLYLDRREAVEAIGKNYEVNTLEADLIREALHDKHWNIRLLAVSRIRKWAVNMPDSVKAELIQIATKDSVSFVRVAAYDALANYFPYQEIAEIFRTACNDSSYIVAAAAFSILSVKDPELALVLADSLERDMSEAIIVELADFYSNKPEKDKFNFFEKAVLKTTNWTQDRVIQNFGVWLKDQKVPVIREGSEILFYAGTNTNNRYTGNQVIASLIKIQNHLDTNMIRMRKLKDKGEFESDRQTGISALEVDIIQTESLQKSIEEKIKLLEKLDEK